MQRCGSLPTQLRAHVEYEDQFVLTYEGMGISPSFPGALEDSIRQVALMSAAINASKDAGQVCAQASLLVGWRVGVAI